ncbi:MAG: cell division inhibitor SepF [Clostridiales bacterium]|jgi:cell division inhibitor SepF|nr:cell division inhibitor SepF [Clostridiales bacterium]MDK2932427.1 cell division inhibitor SepF [Clostridiales bacterium]
MEKIIGGYLMSNFVNKMLHFVGLESQDEYEEVVDNNEIVEPEFTHQSSKKSKIVNIHTTTQLKVVVMQPESFDEAKDIADHLKNKKPVVINLEDVEKDVARRIVDFLSGSVYALDGNIQKISNGIFLVAPYNVDIMGDFKDELRNKGLFPWNL